MKRTYCGAYVAETMRRGCDERIWQPWQREKGIAIEWTEQGVRFRGRTTGDRRQFCGITARRLHPPDASLSAELRVAGPLETKGRYGTVCHLCNVLLGDEESAHGLPDNNGEVAFHTVRVTYVQPQRRIVGELLGGDGWVEIGRSPQMVKCFSNIELKIDARRPGLEFDSTIRNVRLYPRPAGCPVRVWAGVPRPVVGLTVRLTAGADGKVLSEGAVAEDGFAVLPLEDGWVYPLAGAVEALRGENVIDRIEYGQDDTAECEGIYPGDVYVVEPNTLK